MLVLIIDDSEDDVLLLRRSLKRWNPAIEVASQGDGSAALSALQDSQMQPDLIVCDLHMPRMSGVEFVSKARTVEGLEEVPILAFSGSDDTDLFLQFLNHGGTAAISKNDFEADCAPEGLRAWLR